MSTAEISKKLSGYKQQDKRHEIFSEKHFVTVGDVIPMLQGSCTYCLEAVKTLYEPHDKKQWTLDRIDNRMGHNTGNVVAACLECNLKRGDVCSSEGFRFTKQLSIVRKNHAEERPSEKPEKWKSVVKLS